MLLVIVVRAVIFEVVVIGGKTVLSHYVVVDVVERHTLVQPEQAGDGVLVLELRLVQPA